MAQAKNGSRDGGSTTLTSCKVQHREQEQARFRGDRARSAWNKLSFVAGVPPDPEVRVPGEKNKGLAKPNVLAQGMNEADETRMAVDD